MENFMRASGWPMLNCCVMGGYMHPIMVIMDSDLYPQLADDKYFDVLHVASDYLLADFLNFFSGHAVNLNPKAYRQLCDFVIPQDVETEMRAQVALYESWLKGDKVDFPDIYVMESRNQHPSNISSYLSEFEEYEPYWLRRFKEGKPVSFSEIMSGRTAYYPGSGYDGTLIKVGNMSHAVHSYLYVDYGIGKKDLISHLATPNCIRGYHSIGRIEWSEKDIMPNGQYPLNVSKKPRSSYRLFKPGEKPYCFTEIYERDDKYNDDWGAMRFAVTFLFADGIATYYQLFCKEYKRSPWIVLLQDHGLGGNYDKFGKGGLLDAIIKENGILPLFVLCAENTSIWEGYERISGLPPVYGGMHNERRSLWKRNL